MVAIYLPLLSGTLKPLDVVLSGLRAGYADPDLCRSSTDWGQPRDLDACEGFEFKSALTIGGR